MANRGEIALRVARACRELGIRVVAVYSTEDRDSAVVRFADQAVHIGPGPASASYLNMPAIIEAARQAGADAIHPGYGFLSEDPDFAEVCQSNGLVFVGPPAKVIAQLGDKIAARSLMAAADVPLLPGSIEPLRNETEARACAEEIGYPVIIKAAAGGGGRGMQIVRDSADFLAAYRETTARAQTLFGDNRVYVERYVDHPRHVEVQVLCDQHGNAVHLGERDCTVQRRHQKLVEETPAPGLPEEVTARLGETALRGARAVGYVGAGTFEFLVDGNGNFSFMEVNCRIQVEHPVTELTTGIDLVQQQLRIAGGEPLAIGQADVTPRGVAIECRINAEDPERNFAPAPGTLEEFVPAGGPFVRVDTHGFTGYRVPGTYDSLLAKLAVWAPTRDEAIARMRRALGEFRISGPGVRTTADFLAQVVSSAPFRNATHSTALVEHMLNGTVRSGDAANAD